MPAHAPPCLTRDHSGSRPRPRVASTRGNSLCRKPLSVNSITQALHFTCTMGLYHYYIDCVNVIVLIGLLGAIELY